MAFMNSPVTHGTGVVIVTGCGADSELGKISGMLTTTRKKRLPLTKESTTSRYGSLAQRD